MEFFIKKNATLPVLKINVFKDGRSDYDRSMKFLDETEIFFSMVNGALFAIYSLLHSKYTTTHERPHT